jgi:hypothetical protein
LKHPLGDDPELAGPETGRPGIAASKRTDYLPLLEKSLQSGRHLAAEEEDSVFLAKIM